MSVEDRIRAETQLWLGTAYQWGSKSQEGIDCSGFTQAIFEKALQVSLPRTTKEQEKLGIRVDKQSLKAGDLVFFRTGGIFGLLTNRHVGIYLGSQEFVHATSSDGVTISRLDDPLWKKKFRLARRIIDHSGNTL